MRTFLTVVVLAAAAWAAPVHAQRAFASPGEASSALADAIARNDEAKLGDVLGESWRRYVPTDGVERQDLLAFLTAWSEKHGIVAEGEVAHVSVGKDDWVLPIPITRDAAGWRFNLVAGQKELRARRIGRNELAAMKAALAYWDAQNDYAREDRNGDGVLEYAQKIVSSPARHDGLYWPDRAGEEESPLGPFFEGRRSGEGYYGYRFRILKAQGANAPGGAYSYVIKNRMVSGFALVAWPVRYGETGVTTFIVSHDGQVYEKDLGPATERLAQAMSRFDPDPSWRKTGNP